MEKLKSIKFRDCDNQATPMLHIDNSPAMMDSFDSVGIIKVSIENQSVCLSVDQCERLGNFLQRIISNETI